MAGVIEPDTSFEPVATAATSTIRAVPSVRALALGGVIGWSAFLLFLVEPLVGRLVLPVFGGTPSVWATTLCFFQVVLLLGYLYGHVSVTRLGTRGPIVHIALVVMAAVALALAPARVAELRLSTLPDTLNLLWILVVIVGMPAFALTATTPLVSAWAARGDEAGARGDAYWLYALSNAGSLLALLAYPFVIEPRIGLAAQRGAWAIAFGVFAVAIAACAGWASARSRTARRRATPTGGAISSIVNWRRRARWLLLAAVPSGLLNAVTTFIATDLVSAPLIWLIPLAIYLATFVVAFSERGRRVVPLAVTLAPAAVTLLWVPTGSAGAWPILPLVLLAYGGLAVVATALHGRLALDRPPADRLTEFYLLISVGGALAAIFVAIVAPLVFPGVWELPLLLVLALVALAVSEPGADPARLGRSGPRRGRIDFSPFVQGVGGRLGPYVVVAAILLALLVRDGALGTEAGLRWLLVGGLILLVGARPAFLAVSTAFVLALAVLVLQPPAEFRGRSFFGVTTVLRPPGTDFTILMNGTTTHGIQSRDPAKAGIPESYYARPGPFGDLFRALRADGSAKSVAAVGLGAGAIAAYLQPSWSMTFYEIDPLVARVASDPTWFTYLSDAAERPSIVLGDARLSLRDVPDDTYDAIVIDAFSSDAIPAHLLTSEALAEYVRVVMGGGLILVHVSNRYYDLAPAVASAATANDLPTLRRIYVPTDADRDAGAAITDAVIATSSEPARTELRAAGWQDLAATQPPMTDDFLDLLRFLRPLW
jgi:hypothetical protein